jgi:hypothetical protein
VERLDARAIDGLDVAEMTVGLAGPEVSVRAHRVGVDELGVRFRDLAPRAEVNQEGCRELVTLTLRRYPPRRSPSA